MSTLLYTQCRHCHLFVEANSAREDDPYLAPYVHLHRGDEADEALDATHEAQPGESATLNHWMLHGPPAMLARFVSNPWDRTPTVTNGVTDTALSVRYPDGTVVPVGLPVDTTARQYRKIIEEVMGDGYTVLGVIAH